MKRGRVGAEIAFMQFSVPNDRAERSPKGVGSIEFDRRSGSGAYETQWAHLAALGLMGGVFIQEPANHFLIRSIIFFCLFFKKFYAGSAESNCNFKGFVLQGQLFR